MAKTLRPHQQEALSDVFTALVDEDMDRAQLHMACGTGKTFTALQIAQHVVGEGGRVLFAAPSIALVQQSLESWVEDAEITIRPFAVCSDRKVGADADLEIKPTTNAAALAEAAKSDSPEEMTVIFTTYQSMGVIRDAQNFGMPEFDLIVCDEAHRTTGYGLLGKQRSNFTLVHHGIDARKRLYMTATPRIYDPEVKSSIREHAGWVACMDDPSTYGEVVHRLTFRDAIEQELLSDYKVAILTMDERQVEHEFSDIINRDQQAADVGKVIGVLNGMAKFDPAGNQFSDDPKPMRRAVAYLNTIAESKRFMNIFNDLKMETIQAQAHHVDAKTGTKMRDTYLRWLGGDVDDDKCHILTNARCLTEGIDVPALDSVIFMEPRKSMIDVVQAVGRALRKSPGKRFGYIIVPVVISAEDNAQEALSDDADYSHVWQALQAIRAHDRQIEAKIDLLSRGRTDSDNVVQIIDMSTNEIKEPTMEIPSASIYARIVPHYIKQKDVSNRVLNTLMGNGIGVTA